MILEELLSTSLRFEYATGDLTSLSSPNDTDWRRMPDIMISYQKIGNCTLYMRNEPPISVGRRTLVLIPPGVPHRISLDSEAGTYHWVHINYYLFNKLDLFSFLTIPPVIQGPVAQRVSDIIEDWILFSRKPSDSSSLLFNARKHAMGFNLLAALSEKITFVSQSHTKLHHLQQIKPALDRIHREETRADGGVGEKLNRDMLAEICTMSPSQFHRIFQKAMNIGPMEYVRSVRLRQAQQLLLSTDLSIAEIALRIGYEDPFIFSHFFKRECGANPKEYRQSNKRRLH